MMFDPKPVDNRWRDASVGIAPSPETIVHLSQLARAALQAQMSGHAPWMYPLGNEKAWFPEPFERPREEWPHPNYQFDGAPDTSRIVEFMTTHPDRPSTFNFRIDSSEQLSNLCVWLVQHGDTSVRSFIAYAIQGGLFAPASSMESVVRQFLCDPKQPYEFYAALAWCLNQAHWPLAPHFELEGFPDGHHSDDITGHRHAWRLIRAASSAPVDIFPILESARATDGVYQHTVKYLYRMLASGSKKLPVEFKALVDRVMRLEEAPSLVCNDTKGAIAACAFGVAAVNLPFASRLLGILSKRPPPIVGLPGFGAIPDGVQTESEHNERFRPPPIPFTMAQSVFFRRLSAGGDPGITPHLAKRLIRLTLSEIPCRIYGYTRESECLKEVWDFADQHGPIARKAYVHPQFLYHFDSLREQNKRRSHHARKLAHGLAASRAIVRDLGIESRFEALFFTSEPLFTTGTGGDLLSKHLSFLKDVPDHVRLELMETTLLRSNMITDLIPSPETALFVAAIPQNMSLWEMSELGSSFENPVLRKQILSFLLGEPSQRLVERTKWPNRFDDLVECATTRADRLEFLKQFVNVWTQVPEHLEHLYACLDDPEYPHFNRTAGCVSTLFRDRPSLSLPEILREFQAATATYQQLPGPISTQVTDHLGLLASGKRWPHSSASPLSKTRSLLPISKEVEVYAHFVRILGDIKYPGLFREFRNAALLPKKAIYFRTPKAFVERLAQLGTALATHTVRDATEGTPLGNLMLAAVAGVPKSDLRHFRGAYRAHLEGRTTQSPQSHPGSPLVPDVSMHVAAVHRASPDDSRIQDSIVKRIEEICHDLREAERRTSRGMLIETAISREQERLRPLIRKRLAELHGVLGKGERFARSAALELELAAGALNAEPSPLPFIEACARIARTIGRSGEAHFVRATRRIGLQIVVGDIASRHRGWTAPDYDHREQLEGSVGLIREGVRSVDIDLTDQARDLWKRAFSVRGLEEELSRLQQNDLVVSPLSHTSRSIRIDVRVGDPFYADIAGYLCDTCIRERDVLKNHPNATFYTFTRVGASRPRIVGGTFVLEVEIDSGERAWMIRGFNPSLTFCRSINIGDFFEQFVDFLATRARDVGVSKIVVPLEHYSGRSQTNRPSINAYIGRTYYPTAGVIRITNGATLNTCKVTQACSVRTL